MAGYLAAVSIGAKLLRSKHSDEGEVIWEETVDVGYTHEASLNNKYAAVVKAETGKLAKLAGAKFSGETSLEIAGSYSVGFHTKDTTKTTYKMPAGSHAYIYQFVTDGTTTDGLHLHWNGAITMTNKPLEISESEVLIPDQIYWLDNTTMMYGREDDGYKYFYSWPECLQTAKENLEPGQGAVAVWGLFWCTLYIKKNVPVLSRHADMKKKNFYTTFWRLPALKDKTSCAQSASMDSVGKCIVKCKNP